MFLIFTLKEKQAMVGCTPTYFFTRFRKLRNISHIHFEGEAGDGWMHIHLFFTRFRKLSNVSHVHFEGEAGDGGMHTHLWTSLHDQPGKDFLVSCMNTSKEYMRAKQK